MPTRPLRDLLDEDNDGDRYEILKGMDDNVSVVQGMIQSWNPAAKPEGVNELMREFMVNMGLEYWYDDKFAVRGGYQHEDQTKGNRRFYTMGFGLRYSLIGLDFAYLFSRRSVGAIPFGEYHPFFSPDRPESAAGLTMDILA